MTTSAAWEAPVLEGEENPDDQPLVPPIIEEEPVEPEAAVSTEGLAPEASDPDLLVSSDRVELENLRRERIERAEQDNLNKLTNEVRESELLFRTKYAGIYDQETIDTFAKELEGVNVKAIEQREAQANAVKFQADKAAGVAELSKKYGIDPALLQNYNTRQDMEAGAAREQKYMKQEKDIADLKRGRIPRQDVDDGAPAGGVLSGAALETYLGTPNAQGLYPVMTADMSARLDAYYKSQNIR